MQIEINIKDIASPIAKEIISMLRLEIKREMYPLKIKGNARAGELLNISADAIKSRMHKGFYLENYHFKKISDKIIMWDRDALLEDWSNENGKALHENS